MRGRREIHFDINRFEGKLLQFLPVFDKILGNLQESPSPFVISTTQRFKKPSNQYFSKKKIITITSKIILEYLKSPKL